MPEKKQISHRVIGTVKKAKADLITANDTGRKGVGFSYDTNEVFIVDANRKVVHVSLTTKREVAKRLFDVIISKLEQNVR